MTKVPAPTRRIQMPSRRGSRRPSTRTTRTSSTRSGPAIRRSSPATCSRAICRRRCRTSATSPTASGARWCSTARPRSSSTTRKRTVTCRGMAATARGSRFRVRSRRVRAMTRAGSSVKHSWLFLAAVCIAVAAVAAVTRVTGHGGPPVVFAPGVSDVTVTPNEAARRVDIAIGGKPFTSYVWPERLKKPVLYPLRSATGTLVTRGWPFDPRPGERIDHPHQVGLWFDYGNVNGVDFWNNSEALKPEEAAKMGSVGHRKIVEARGGPQSGRLVVDMDWIGPDNALFLHQRAEYTFSGDAEKRVVDQVTTLTAADQRVVFNDNKEGMFGM